MNRIFMLLTLWAGFRAFWKERLWAFAWDMWKHAEVERAILKWKNGPDGKPEERRTYHLMKNIGQEFFQAINAYDDVEEAGEDGKRGYKIAAGMTLTALFLGILFGATLFATIAWVL